MQQSESLLVFVCVVIVLQDLRPGIEAEECKVFC